MGVLFAPFRLVAALLRALAIAAAAVLMAPVAVARYCAGEARDGEQAEGGACAAWAGCMGLFCGHDGDTRLPAASPSSSAVLHWPSVVLGCYAAYNSCYVASMGGLFQVASALQIMAASFASNEFQLLHMGGLVYVPVLPHAYRTYGPRSLADWTLALWALAVACKALSRQLQQRNQRTSRR